MANLAQLRHAESMKSKLTHAISFYGELIREAIALYTGIGDAGTADLLTQIYRGADMNLWFVEAHDQAEQ